MDQIELSINSKFFTLNTIELVSYNGVKVEKSINGPIGRIGI